MFAVQTNLGRLGRLSVAVCLFGLVAETLQADELYRPLAGEPQGTLTAHFQSRAADSPFAAMQSSFYSGSSYGGSHFGGPACGSNLACGQSQACAPSSPFTTPGDMSPAPSSQPASPQFNLNATPTGLVPSARTVAAAGGYIDPAFVATNVRFRYDAAYGFDAADRAEFFYSTWDTFGGKTPVRDVGPNDNVDAQYFKLYYEQLVFEDISLFIEAPFIFNNPSGVPGPGPNTSGFGDLHAGFKWALYQSDTTIFTFQLKNYIAIGDPDKWLTAGHSSIEPGLLFATAPSERWSFEGELRDWIPIQGAVNPLNGRDYAGNVLRYGLGASYAVVDNCHMRVSPVLEFVGWSVLDGQKFAFNRDGSGRGPVNAGGDTIVNGKFGVRIGFGQSQGFPTQRRDSIYIGYGRSLTGDRWYQDILRVEYRMFF